MSGHDFREKLKKGAVTVGCAVLAIVIILWNLWGFLNIGWVLEHSPY